MQNNIFGVCGAGTMGSGIAYSAALAGRSVLLYDVSQQALERGVAHLESFLAGGIKRGKISAEDAASLRLRVTPILDVEMFRDAEIVVEAAIEDLNVKRSLFGRLEAIVADNTILATNTSSLPITGIASGLRRADRVVGMHFFNPAHLMKLVEVVVGVETSKQVIDQTIAIAHELGKTPVTARDTPGFIVNRVARNFYGEALRIVGEGAATHEQVDRCMKAIGFKMGPFELMDLIGIDINLAVTRSVYDQYFDEARFRPHLIQSKMVESGKLGRKSGGGFYPGT